MRIEATIKLGYYPAPGSVVDTTRKALVFPEEEVTVLDPCCGEGIAVKLLLKGIHADTYGVELDKARADQAMQRLKHVIIGDCRQTHISKGAFSLLWLNPPYDHEEDKRLEYLFLRHTAECLQPGGVLVFLVQEKQLRALEGYLTSRFEHISWQRFPEKEYEMFGQVMLMAVKRKRTENPSSLPDAGGLQSYAVPPGKRVKVFRSDEIPPEELDGLIKGSVLWERLLSRTLASVERRAPLPLHRGHLGLLLAAGKLDGMHGDGHDRHIVRGKVTKRESTTQTVNEDGSSETRVLESFSIAIKVLTQDGSLRVLQ